MPGDRIGGERWRGRCRRCRLGTRAWNCWVGRRRHGGTGPADVHRPHRGGEGFGGVPAVHPRFPGALPDRGSDDGALRRPPPRRHLRLRRDRRWRRVPGHGVRAGRVAASRHGSHRPVQPGAGARRAGWRPGRPRRRPSAGCRARRRQARERSGHAARGVPSPRLRAGRSERRRRFRRQPGLRVSRGGAERAGRRSLRPVQRRARPLRAVDRRTGVHRRRRHDPRREAARRCAPPAGRPAGRRPGAAGALPRSRRPTSDGGGVPSRARGGGRRRPRPRLADTSVDRGARRRRRRCRGGAERRRIWIVRPRRGAGVIRIDRCRLDDAPSPVAAPGDAAASI